MGSSIFIAFTNLPGHVTRKYPATTSRGTVIPATRRRQKRGRMDGFPHALDKKKVVLLRKNETDEDFRISVLAELNEVGAAAPPRPTRLALTTLAARARAPHSSG